MSYHLAKLNCHVGIFVMCLFALLLAFPCVCYCCYSDTVATQWLADFPKVKTSIMYSADGSHFLHGDTYWHKCWYERPVRGERVDSDLLISAKLLLASFASSDLFNPHINIPDLTHTQTHAHWVDMIAWLLSGFSSQLKCLFQIHTWPLLYVGSVFVGVCVHMCLLRAVCTVCKARIYINCACVCCVCIYCVCGYC